MRENSRYHEAENHTGQDNTHTLVIEGRNAVLEAFRSGKPIDKVFVLDGCQDGTVRTIVREAKKHDALLNFVTKERLSQISETGKHQGVVAYAAAYEYSTVDDMLALAEERGEDPEAYPENTSLQKALKNYLSEGKKTGAGYGCRIRKKIF